LYLQNFVNGLGAIGVGITVPPHHAGTQ